MEEKNKTKLLISKDERAYWIHNGEYWMCSKCDAVFKDGPYEQCPHCGREMSGTPGGQICR